MLGGGGCKHTRIHYSSMFTPPSPFSTLYPCFFNYYDIHSCVRNRNIKMNWIKKQKKSHWVGGVSSLNWGVFTPGGRGYKNITVDIWIPQTLISLALVKTHVCYVNKKFCTTLQIRARNFCWVPMDNFSEDFTCISKKYLAKYSSLGYLAYSRKIHYQILGPRVYRHTSGTPLER